MDAILPACTGSDFTEQHESTLQPLKRLKQAMPLAVNELWDAHNRNFVDDTASMAKIKLIRDAAQDRQGRVTSSPLQGQNLLDQWYASLSQCRVIVERHEIANIILDSPNGKKPGPDGFPAAFLKRYCHQLAIIFQKAWIELSSGCAPIDHVRICLGFKKWIVVPKMEGEPTQLTNYVILCQATKFVKCWLGCFSKFWMRFVNMNLMDSATHSKLS